MVELLASASESLADDGPLLVEEGDRFYNMAILGKYRDVVYEGDEERVVLSMGAGYDALRGAGAALLGPRGHPRACMAFLRGRRLCGLRGESLHGDDPG
jgi:hypothetical protein